MTAAFKPLTKEDVSDVLGVSIRTIENWVNDGTLPGPKHLGNRVYWHPSVFYGWLEQRLTADEQPGAGEFSGTVAPAATRTQSAKPARGSKPAKTEIDRLRNRESAKLEALMA